MITPSTYIGLKPKIVLQASGKTSGSALSRPPSKAVDNEVVEADDGAFKVASAGTGGAGEEAEQEIGVQRN